MSAHAVVEPMSEPEEAVAVLTEAFSTDPFFAFINGQRYDVLSTQATYRALLRHGGHLSIDVARVAGVVRGAAVWEAPGLRQRPLDTVRMVATLLSDVGLRRTLTGARAEMAHAAARPPQPHWYLAAIGVGAAARGLGVGSALLGHRLAIADADGVSAYLEATTARSRDLYARHGFVVTGRVAIPGLTGGRPYAMLRDAAG